MADGGRIVNLSTSITGFMLPTYSAYAASKGAVEQITRILAEELGPRGITVNAVSPGPTDTELFGQGKTEEGLGTFTVSIGGNRECPLSPTASPIRLLALSLGAKLFV